jgi:hypothetical protein
MGTDDNPNHRRRGTAGPLPSRSFTRGGKPAWDVLKRQQHVYVADRAPRAKPIVEGISTKPETATNTPLGKRPAIRLLDF